MLYTLDKNLKRENKFKKYFIMSITSILLGLVGTFIIALIIGFRPIIINGGSMLPTFHRFDIIMIYKPAQEEFKVGDILTYQFENGDLCTHRIIEIDEDGYYHTKGDNSDADAYKISYNKEAGKPTVFGKTYYAIPTGKILSWFMHIDNNTPIIEIIITFIAPTTIALVAGIWLLVQLNKISRDFCNENVDEI